MDMAHDHIGTWGLIPNAHDALPLGVSRKTTDPVKLTEGHDSEMPILQI